MPPRNAPARPTAAAPVVAASAAPGRAAAAAARAKVNASAEPKQHWLRALADELFFVFAIVMFFKLFIVDLYKIPSGSMTPTLIGGMVADVDMNQDGKKDLAFWSFEQSDEHVVAFLRQPDGTLATVKPERADLPYGQDPRFVPPEVAHQWRAARLPYMRYDRILVNKVAYWFKSPRRGQIVVFKVPESIYRIDAPIYIKRLAGEPNDVLTFDLNGRLIANGKLIEDPPFYKTQYYSRNVDFGQRGTRPFPENKYDASPEFASQRHLLEVHVPAGQAYVFGDNTLGSLDSRYWGGVPLDNFKGRAFFRLFPFDGFGFLK